MSLKKVVEFSESEGDGKFVRPTIHQQEEVRS